jgi:hypothetical protein
MDEQQPQPGEHVPPQLAKLAPAPPRDRRAARARRADYIARATYVSGSRPRQQAMSRPAPRQRSAWIERLLAATIVAALLVAGLSLLALASAHALPGELLYPLKLALLAVQRLLHPAAAALAALCL